MHIRIISPAGQINAKVVQKGICTLQSWGHQVSLGVHALDEYGRFAGTPEDRLQDIIDALSDPEVDILWATRGGYGCMQILDQIPLEIIKKANKPLFGYSDITALHARWQQAGIKSVHAPMMKHLGDDPTHRTSKTLREMLEYYSQHKSWPAKQNSLFLQKADPYQTPEMLDAAEKLKANPPSFVGGNLSVLCGLMGTPYNFNFKNHVLFIEDVGEPAYKIDRMLNQLRLSGILNEVKGLVCGHFTNCDNDPSMQIRLWDGLRLLAAPFNIPLFLGCPIGHELENYPVIEG